MEDNQLTIDMLENMITKVSRGEATGVTIAYQNPKNREFHAVNIDGEILIPQELEAEMESIGKRALKMEN